MTREPKFICLWRLSSTVGCLMLISSFSAVDPTKCDAELGSREQSDNDRGAKKTLFLSWFKLETKPETSPRISHFTGLAQNLKCDSRHFTQSFRFRRGCRVMSVVSLKTGHKSENFSFCQHQPGRRGVLNFARRLDIWMKWKSGQVCGLICARSHVLFAIFLFGTSVPRPAYPPSNVEMWTTPKLPKGRWSRNMSISQSTKLKMSGYFVLVKLGFFSFAEGPVNGGRVKRLWKGNSRKRKCRVGWILKHGHGYIFQEVRHY